MSVTVSEACAVNTLLDWLLEHSPTTASRDRINAAAILAAAAHKRLGTGWSAEAFRALWLQATPTLAVREAGEWR